ncbi:uncharacterized protein T551_00974 [Pneumocystis jirovecii RU7]|uniref:Cyclin-like domain-containing protein n=1 Tax=Pneumocystis jirovecii (strain RU7) TaxID=1408657 RepID=A0A0W4ZTN1_PNEJ7|nr:uncharacterized protein T551_00974 [Pneumocystis jirovecii RU7]KTW31713.1 hypothetical protein T551_00974 [Pneumocystis jirovecii RU7]
MFRHVCSFRSISLERKHNCITYNCLKEAAIGNRKRHNYKENGISEGSNKSIFSLDQIPMFLSTYPCFLKEWIVMSERMVPFETTIVFENILASERHNCSRINPMYMEQVQRIPEVDFWRKNLIRWFHTRPYYLITKDTAAIATVLLDRCLSVMPINKRSHIFKVGIGCLFIATKLTSDFIVSRKEFLKVCGVKKINQVPKLDKFERNVLIALDFHIFVDSIYVFEINISEILLSHNVFKKIKENKRQKIRRLAMSYFDDVFISIQYLAYRPSEIVAACLWLAIIEVLSYPISLLAIVDLVKTNIDRFYAIMKLLRCRSVIEKSFNCNNFGGMTLV